MPPFLLEQKCLREQIELGQFPVRICEAAVLRQRLDQGPRLEFRRPVNGDIAKSRDVFQDFARERELLARRGSQMNRPVGKSQRDGGRR
jgi:hypothetical protein